MRAKKSRLSQRLVSGVVSLGLILAPLTFLAQKAEAAPFVCVNQFYQVILGTLKTLDSTTGTYTTIGNTGSLSTNAIGYNVLDNYIYGWQQLDNFSQGTLGLVRIEDDATTTPLGIPAGLPTPGTYVAGDFDTSGNLYLARGGTDELYRVDVSSNTATLVTMSATLSLQEIVYVNGLLYSVSGTTLYEIDPVSGNVTSKSLAITPDPGNPSSVYGAGWASDTTRLYFSRNSDGKIFEISGYGGVSPVATPVLIGESTLGNDGAACITGHSPIPPLAAISDTGATQKNTVLTVAVPQGLLFNDTGQTITVASNTQPTHGSVVVNLDGSYTYTPATDYVGTDSFTYTITDANDQTSTATVAITVASPTVIATLADTGSSQLPIVALGLVLAVTGWLTLFTKRYKHSLLPL